MPIRVPSCDFASWLGTLCILQQPIAHTVDPVKHGFFKFYPLHLLWTSSTEETTLDFWDVASTWGTMLQNERDKSGESVKEHKCYPFVNDR